MFPLTEPPSFEAVHSPPADEPPCAEMGGGNSPGVAAMNPFVVRWLQTIADDGRLPSDALEVAIVMARSVGIGRVAFTDWQRVNTAIGRNRRDLAVFETMSELALEGYIDRNIDDRFGRNYGWSLLIPEGEL